MLASDAGVTLPLCVPIRRVHSDKLDELVGMNETIVIEPCKGSLSRYSSRVQRMVLILT